MIEQPILETLRLRLRPLNEADATAIQRVASIREIADSMISLPHPYPPGEAERYIAKQEVEKRDETAFTFAVVQKADEAFCGVVELRAIEREHSQGELSFWLSVDVWGLGYMSEVLQAVIKYGFRELGLNRLYAYHMVRNPASGRVLKKNGFRQEGVLRQRVRKWDVFEDVALWAMLQSDFQGG